MEGRGTRAAAAGRRESTLIVVVASTAFALARMLQRATTCRGIRGGSTLRNKWQRVSVCYECTALAGGTLDEATRPGFARITKARDCK